MTSRYHVIQPSITEHALILSHYIICLSLYVDCHFKHSSLYIQINGYWDDIRVDICCICALHTIIYDMA